MLYLGNQKICPIITVESSSGGSTVGDYLIRVFDYDGTIIDRQYLNQGDTYTLPQAPTHSNLVFQEWSSSATITNNTVTVTDNNIDIGAIYTTKSGKSEFDISLNVITNKTFSLLMDGTKDWGDGTVDTETSHTYADYGDYTVTCDGSNVTKSGGYRNLFNVVQSNNYIVKNIRLAKITEFASYLLSYNFALETLSLPNTITGSIGNGGLCYNHSLKHINLPSGITSLGDEVCSNNYSLESMVIPSSVLSVGSSVFYQCYGLKSLTLLHNDTLKNNTFYYCFALDSFKIPDEVTSIGNNCFQQCRALNGIKIPSGVTQINTSAFRQCPSLGKVNIPKSVSQINSYSFYDCTAVKEYDFSHHESVPTLSSTNAFNNINGACKIKVPSALAATWKTTTNWVTYANYIIGV